MLHTNLNRAPVPSHLWRTVPNHAADLRKHITVVPACPGHPVARAFWCGVMAVSPGPERLDLATSTHQRTTSPHREPGRPHGRETHGDRGRHGVPPRGSVPQQTSRVCPEEGTPLHVPQPVGIASRPLGEDVPTVNEFNSQRSTSAWSSPSAFRLAEPNGAHPFSRRSPRRLNHTGFCGLKLQR